MTDAPRTVHVSADLRAPLEALFDEAYPERLREVAMHLYTGLIEADELTGLPHEQLARIALDQTELLSLELGGDSFYMHRGHRYRLTLRDRQIAAEFNGRNHHELARKHDLSVVRIYQILAAIREEEFSRRQGKLGLDDPGS